MQKELTKRILTSIFLLPIVLFIIHKGSLIFTFFILICFLISSYEWHKMSKKMSHKLLGLIFLFFSFYSIYKLRNDFNNTYLFLLFVTIVCISTDIGGYFFGKFLKGPKLSKISPNKTYAGMIGGFLLSIISTIIFMNYTIQDELILHWLIFAFLISCISQFGDFIISYFKRLSKIKDTGKIIPGHGGLLDRIDGMIFAFPFSYIILLTNFV